jgi:hypothetical protein
MVERFEHAVNEQAGWFRGSSAVGLYTLESS